MRRRALLATLATTAIPLAAGCADDGTEGPTDGTEPSDGTGTSTDDTGTSAGGATEAPAGEATETTTESTTERGADQSTEGHARVTVEDVAVQQGYVVREVADAIGVTGDDRRYVWTRVSVEGTAVAPDAFALDAAVDEYEPVEQPRAYRFEGTESPYTLQSGSGLLLFELPLDVETTRDGHVPEMSITWPGGDHPLDRTIAESIAYGPPSLSVSIRKQYDETPATPIAIEVENEGGADRGAEVAGRFVGALNRQGPDVEVTPVQRVVVDVPTGETRTVDVEDDWSERTPGGSRGEDQPAVEYALHWAGDSSRVTFDEL